MVVVVILSLILTTVPPLLSGGVSRAESKGAVRQLAAGLRRARSQAIFKREEAALVLDVERRRYQIEGAPKEVQLPEDLKLTLDTARTEVVDEDKGRIRFFPDGSSTGGRVTITGDKREYTVDVDWMTGRIALRD